MNNHTCAGCGTAWNRSWGWGSDLCPECVEDAADVMGAAAAEGEYS